MTVSERARVLLGELVNVKHGWAFKSECFSEVLTGKPIVVGVGNFRYTGGFRFNETTIKEYRGLYPKEYELQPDDILLVMTCQTSGGEILGIPARVPRDGRIYLHNQRLGKVVVKDRMRVDPNYLYWLFLWNEFNRELASSASGTKILHTAPDRIEAFRFELPAINEQRAIARILSALQDKIELNRRINEILEATARSTFSDWFVNFGPTRAKMEGREAYLSPEVWEYFPDKLNAEGLPMGWRREPLLQHARLLSGGTPKTSEPLYWNGELMWASAKDVSQCSDLFLLHTDRLITQLGLEESATRVIPKLATAIVARGATTGRFCMFGRDMAMNQTCYALTSICDRPVWLNCAFGSIVEGLVHAAHGSVFDTITTTTFEKANIVIPTDPLLDRFEKIIGPMLLSILANTEESAALAVTRDMLIPKLMSGKLAVQTANVVGAVL
jgi:type I restriction enzyme S subunit